VISIEPLILSMKTIKWNNRKEVIFNIYLKKALVFFLVKEPKINVFAFKQKQLSPIKNLNELYYTTPFSPEEKCNVFMTCISSPKAFRGGR